MSDCRSLLLAAASVREIGDYASAGRYLALVAEQQPDNRELWIERTRLHIDEGAFDAAAESAARLEALPGSVLLGRLLAAQAAAATEPLRAALDTLRPVLEPEDFESDELLHIKSTAGILTVSVRNFGPKYLPQGLAKLRDLLTHLPDEGVVSDILTDFLIEMSLTALWGLLRIGRLAWRALFPRWLTSRIAASPSRCFRQQ